MRFRTIEPLGDANNRDRVFLDAFVEGLDPLRARLLGGERFGVEFPVDARIALQPESQGVQLTSFLSSSNMLVVAPVVREVIETFCKGTEVECLPFALLDHRKRVLSKDYAIVNPIGTVDCLDLKASDIVFNRRRPDDIVHINKVVLDRARAKDAPALFRLHRQASTYIFRSDLAEAIDALKPTNFVWEPLAFADEVRK